MNDFIPVCTHYMQVICTEVEIHGTYYGFFRNGFFRNGFSDRNFIFNDKNFFERHLFYLSVFLCPLCGGGHIFDHFVGILHCFCFRFGIFGTVAIVLFKEKHKCAGYSGYADSHGNINPPSVASRGAD